MDLQFITSKILVIVNSVNMFKFLLFAEIVALSFLSFLLAGCENQVSKAKELEKIDGLVAYWDFSTDDYLTAKGPEHPRLRGLEESMPQLVDEGPLSGRALHFDGNEYLYIPYTETGGLNVSRNAVSVIAWIRWKTGQIGFIGGMWNEYEDGGKRQYGLFVSLPHYNGENQVCGHISQSGKPTPPFPYSIDYSASPQVVPDGEWCVAAFTYDGTYIRSYLNGRFESREAELIEHTKGFEGYPDGLVQVKNPYYFPDGIGDNGSDFTVGAVFVNNNIGNYFRGDIGGIAVFNRALTDAEIEYVSNLNKN